MEHSRMDTAPGAPEQPLAFEQPGAGAVPVMHLVPAPAVAASAPRALPEPWSGAVRVAVSGVAASVTTAELGRRAGAPMRLTAVCSAGACAAVVVPWLVPELVRRLNPG